MGGPASSIVAEIYMISIQTTAITTSDTPPRIWDRHVEDVFSILRRCNLEQFFQHINNLHPKTKFTMEKEENSTIPFLNALIQRNQNGTISVKQSTENPHILTSIWTSHLIIQPDQNKASSQHYLTKQKKSSPTIQNLNKSSNTSRKSSSPMDTASNSLTKPEDNGILNNKIKATTNQLKKNLNQSEESICLTSKATVKNFKEHYPRTT